jgi:hypothetical protein
MSIDATMETTSASSPSHSSVSASSTPAERGLYELTESAPFAWLDVDVDFERLT